MSLHDELMDAANEKTREWEDFQQNTVIISKLFTDVLKDKAGIESLRYHAGPAEVMLPDTEQLPKAIRIHDGGWSKVFVKFDLGHQTVKIPLEARVHAGEAQLQVFSLQESFSWPIKAEQEAKLAAFVEMVIKAAVEDMKNDLELFMQGEENRGARFT